MAYAQMSDMTGSNNKPPVTNNSGNDLNAALTDIVSQLRPAIEQNGTPVTNPNPNNALVGSGLTGALSVLNGGLAGQYGDSGNGGIPGGSENLADDGSGAGDGGGGGGGYYSGGSGSSGGRKVYTAPTLPAATSQEAYINAMYDAYQQAQENQLRAAYEANMNTLEQQAAELPTTYNAAVNQANAQAAINRANFNEAAAASGLNTGAGSQARLAQNNALLGNVSQIRQAQAQAQARLDNERAQLEVQYKNAIADAIAQNDLARAQALYQEARRVDESIVNTAINQANLDWSVWSRLYGR